MVETKKIYHTVDDYVASFPESIQKLMQTYRSIIKEVLPEASERISWGMPTFYYYGNVIHFAGHKSHMGIYPGADAVAHFQEELRDYKTSKGSIQVPYGQEIPVSLIQKMTCYSAQQNEMSQIRRSKEKVS